MLNVPEIGCVSVSFRTASADIRGKLAFTEDVIRDMLAQLKKQGLQAVILCTCNSTELYYCGNGSDSAVKILYERSEIPADELLPYTDIYRNERAITHLFRVAGGLSSMVIGEDEILHQTKKAYQLAVSCDAVRYELNRCFQDAIACGKKIRSETFISQIPLSTATIAANAAADLGGSVRVLVIGASGKIGSSVLKNLLAHKNVSVSATSRRHGTDIAFGEKVRVVDFANRYSEIDLCDCVISATSSPHHTVTLHELKSNKVRGKKLFIDLAVPADIDSSINGFDGSELIDIDCIGKLAEQNSSSRRFKVGAAAVIIGRETDRLKKELLYHRNELLLNSTERVLSSEPRSAIFALKKRLDAAEFEAVLNILTEL